MDRIFKWIVGTAIFIVAFSISVFAILHFTSAEKTKNKTQTNNITEKDKKSEENKTEKEPLKEKSNDQKTEETKKDNTESNKQNNKSAENKKDEPVKAEENSSINETNSSDKIFQNQNEALEYGKKIIKEKSEQNKKGYSFSISSTKNEKGEHIGWKINVVEDNNVNPKKVKKSKKTN